MYTACQALSALLPHTRLCQWECSLSNKRKHEGMHKRTVWNAFASLRSWHKIYSLRVENERPWRNSWLLFSILEQTWTLKTFSASLNHSYKAFTVSATHRCVESINHRFGRDLQLRLYHFVYVSCAVITVKVLTMDCIFGTAILDPTSRIFFPHKTRIYFTTLHRWCWFKNPLRCDCEEASRGLLLLSSVNLHDQKHLEFSGNTAYRKLRLAKVVDTPLMEQALFQARTPLGRPLLFKTRGRRVVVDVLLDEPFTAMITVFGDVEGQNPRRTFVGLALTSPNPTIRIGQ